MDIKEFKERISVQGTMLHVVGNSHVSAHHDEHLLKVKGILEHGILPITEQLKIYEKEFVGIGPDIQSMLGLFDCVSVFDPSYGGEVNFKGDFKETYRNLKNKIEDLAWKNNDYSKGKERDLTGNIYDLFTHHNPDSPSSKFISFNKEAFFKEKYKPFFNELGKLVEDSFSNKEKYSSGKEDDLPYFFSMDKLTYPVSFFINPSLERHIIAPSIYQGESFIKGKINLEDINLVTVSDNCYIHKGKKPLYHEFCEEIKPLCEKKGIPFFEYNRKEHSGFLRGLSP